MKLHRSFFLVEQELNSLKIVPFPCQKTVHSALTAGLYQQYLCSVDPEQRADYHELRGSYCWWHDDCSKPVVFHQKPCEPVRLQEEGLH